MKDLTITIVGNNNVGKSSLFNFLTKSNKALVSDSVGMTLDRNYGFFSIKDKRIVCIDTISYQICLERELINQLVKAINEANIILFLVDATLGLTYSDISLSRFLHMFDKRIILLVNKIELNRDISEFWQMGYKILFGISLKKRIGINSIYNGFLKYLFDTSFLNFSKRDNLKIKRYINNEYIYKDEKIIKNIVVIGQPNVGKSTLINKLVKDDRVIVNNKPGTTHDSIDIALSYKDQDFIIVDTAGIYRSSQIEYKNKFSDIIIQRSLNMVNKADLVIFMIDANRSLSNKDSFILNYLFDKGLTFFIVVNKIDTINNTQYKYLKYYLLNKKKYLKFTKIIFISALFNIGIKKIFKNINEINNVLKERKISTSLVTNIMNYAVLRFNRNNSSLTKKKIKFKFAHLGGWSPILIIIHGKNLQKLENNHIKYLYNLFCKRLGLAGHQIKIYLKN